MSEKLSEIDQLRAENKNLKKRLEVQLLRWEECEGVFVTTKEKELRDDLARQIKLIHANHECHEKIREKLEAERDDFWERFQSQMKLQQINHNGHVKIREGLLNRIKNMRQDLERISDPTPPHPGRPSYRDWELREIARATINHDDVLEMVM